MVGINYLIIKLKKLVIVFGKLDYILYFIKCIKNKKSEIGWEERK